MAKEQFVGTWRLITSEFRTSSGKVSYPFGKEPMGIIIYNAEGYVSAQIMRLDRPTFFSGDPQQGTAEEIKAAFQGCITYYGSYEIDEKERIVSHIMEGSSFPNWEGQAHKRYYEFADDRLILSTPEMQMGGETIKGVVTWKRAKPVLPKTPGCSCC